MKNVVLALAASATILSGKPVEVNVLWFNALLTQAAFAWLLRRASKSYFDLAEKVRAGFQRFWDTPESPLELHQFRYCLRSVLCFLKVWRTPGCPGCASRLTNCGLCCLQQS